MSNRNVWLASLVLVALTVSTAQAQINGIKSHLRTFNDFSTTTLVVANGNSVNQGPILSSVALDETVWSDDGIGGSFANRHDFTLSSDNGATDRVFSIDEDFSVKAYVTLGVGNNAPRKEAGFRINSPITGDALFLVNSDAGEIVAFGGGAPFNSFSSGAQPDYVPGTTILMGMNFRANGAAANTTEYFIDRGLGGGIESSGALPWSNLEEGPISFTVSMYSQSSPNLTVGAAPEFVSVDFTDIMYQVPEPTTFALFGLAAIGLAGIRRRSK